MRRIQSEPAFTSLRWEPQHARVAHESDFGSQQRSESTPPCFVTGPMLELPSPGSLSLKDRLLADLQTLYAHFIPGCEAVMTSWSKPWIYEVRWYDLQGSLMCHMSRTMKQPCFDDDDTHEEHVLCVEMHISLAYVHPSYRGLGVCTSLIGAESDVLKKWFPDPHVHIVMTLAAGGAYGESTGVAYWALQGAEFGENHGRFDFLDLCYSWCDSVVATSLGIQSAKKIRTELDTLQYPWSAFPLVAAYESQAPSMQTLKNHLVRKSLHGWDAILCIRPATPASPFAMRVHKARETMQRSFSLSAHQPFLLRTALGARLRVENDIYVVCSCIEGLCALDSSDVMKYFIGERLASRPDVVAFVRTAMRGAPLPRWVMQPILRRVKALALANMDQALLAWTQDALNDLE